MVSWVMSVSFWKCRPSKYGGKEEAKCKREKHDVVKVQGKARIEGVDLPADDSEKKVVIENR